MKITQYRIVTADSANSLEDLVNSYIREAWVPHGNVFVYEANTGFGRATRICQPMVQFRMTDEEVAMQFAARAYLPPEMRNDLNQP